MEQSHSDSSAVVTMRLVSAILFAAIAAAFLVAEPAHALGIRSSKSAAAFKHGAKATRATVNLADASDLMVLTVSACLGLDHPC